jgi:hypothetical protein
MPSTIGTAAKRGIVPIDITAAEVGTIVATNGELIGLACLSPPPPGVPPPHAPHNSSDRLFTLVDDSRPGQPRTLINFDPFTRPLSRNVLLQNTTYVHPFGNLRVQSCPAGATFRLNIQ